MQNSTEKLTLKKSRKRNEKHTHNTNLMCLEKEKETERGRKQHRKKKKRAKRMIVLMASTCLQNDCQKQPETEMEPEQASGVRRHKATQSERDSQRVGSGARNCFYALAFSICVSLRVPFDLLALLFSTCDSDTLELVICPPPLPLGCHSYPLPLPLLPRYILCITFHLAFVCTNRAA